MPSDDPTSKGDLPPFGGPLAVPKASFSCPLSILEEVASASKWCDTSSPTSLLVQAEPLAAQSADPSPDHTKEEFQHPGTPEHSIHSSNGLSSSPSSTDLCPALTPPPSPSSAQRDRELLLPSTVVLSTLTPPSSPSSTQGDEEPQPPSQVILSIRTLPSSPSSAQGDDIDGWLPSALICTIKTAVLHLLNVKIHNYQWENCHGCKVNHPSQREHPCLNPLEDYFYQEHFYNPMQRCCTRRFLPAIHRLLTLHHIRTNDDSVKAVAETLLLELKGVRKIHDIIHEMFDELIR